LFTQHFFEQRERRKIILEKYEETMKSLFHIGLVFLDISILLQQLETDTDSGEISDSTKILFKDLTGRLISKSESHYYQDLVSITNIKYYDNYFYSLADKFQENAIRLCNNVLELFRDISENEPPQIKNTQQLLSEVLDLSGEIQNQMRSRIEVRMRPPFWERSLNHVKKIFYW